MSKSEMLLPFDEELICDLIKLGFPPRKIAGMMEHQLMYLFENCFEYGNDGLEEAMNEDYVQEFVEKHFPSIAAEWERQTAETQPQPVNLPLVWKELTIPHNTAVRMIYRGNQHYASVKNGKIEDETGRYTPSEWASKVADGTVRNAWRDIWFKKPMEQEWKPAQALRDEAQRKRGSAFPAES